MSDGMSRAAASQWAADRRARVTYADMSDADLKAETERLHGEARAAEARLRSAEAEARKAQAALDEAERAYALRLR